MDRVLEILRQAAARRRPSPAAERRRTVRVQAEHPLTWRRGDEVRPAVALDVSLGGMRLKLDGPLAPGETIEVLRDTRALRARVAWWDPDSGTCGVEFEASAVAGSWVLDLLQSLFADPEGMVDRRRSLRVDAHLPARLETGGEEQHGTLLDLGLGGGRMEALRALPAGTEAVLVLRPPELDRPLVLTARVLEVRQVGPGAQHRLEFTDTPPEDAQRLEELVLALLARRIG